MFHRSPRALPLIAGVLLAAAATLASGQSLPRYTMRELIKPTGGDMCGFWGDMNANGDVVQACRFTGGTRTETVLTCLGPYATFCYNAKVKKTWTRFLPVWWPAGGSARTLSLPIAATVERVYLSDVGEVIATGLPIDTLGYTTQSNQVAWRVPAGSTMGVDLPPPGGQPASTFALTRASHSGHQWWSDKSDQRHLLANAQGQSLDIATPPTTGTVTSEEWPALGEGGQLAYSRRLYTDATRTTLINENWLWTGQRWQAYTLPGNAFPDMNRRASINASGHLLITDWNSGLNLLAPERSSTPQAIQLDGALNPGLHLLDAADRAYGDAVVTGIKNVSAHALVWANGQWADINTLVNSRPSSWHITFIRAVNARGQVLAQVNDNSRTGSAAERMVVLTPVP